MNQLSRTIRLGIPAVLLIVTAISFSGCDFNNINSPLEELDIRVKNIARNTLISVNFLDASTGDRVPAAIQVTMSGQDKDAVITTTNEPLQTVMVRDGVLLFSVLDALEPTLDTPVKLTLVCTADGYINTSKPIELTSTGMSRHTVIMTNANNPPAGVISATVTGGLTDANTGVAEDISVSSGTEPLSGGSASIHIPAGTQLLDAAGNALSGTVETRVTYFNPREETSLSAFPGGFSVNLSNGFQGSSRGIFETAGFVAIDMNVGGIPVERFSENTTLSFNIPADISNPETNQQVQSGDVVPLWSYNEDTGEWTAEGDVQLSRNQGFAHSGIESAQFQAVAEGINHLSYWNIDWFDGEYCERGVTLNFVSTGGCFKQVNVELRDPATGNLINWWAENVVYGSDPTQELQYVPPGQAVTVEVYEYGGWFSRGELLTSVDIPDLCVIETVDIEFESDSELMPVTIRVEAICENDQTRVLLLDGVPVFVRQEGEFTWTNLGLVSNGELTACLEPGARYYATVFFDNTWYNSEDYNNGQPYQLDETDLVEQPDGTLLLEYIIENVPEICDEL